MAKLSRPKQNELIKIEVEKLEDIFKDLSDDKREIASGLIKRIAFMNITLDILEDDIKIRGPICKFEQGSQKMNIENPSQKSYNVMINRYTTAYNNLFNLLPKKVESGKDDEFNDF